MKKRRDKNAPVSHPFLESFNSSIHSKSKRLLVIAALVYLILSFFTFNLRVSEGGDDSTYIIRALSLLEEGRFPGYQGPLYPIVLAGFATIFGFSVEILKLSSWLFLSITIFLLFKALSNRVSPLALWGTIFALVVNHHFLFFGSQTYSEAFFMAIQGLFLLYLFRTMELSINSRLQPHQSLIIALLLFAMTLTRSIAIVALPAIVVFWLIHRQRRAAILTTTIFVLLTLLFIGAKSWLTDAPVSGSEQVNTLLLKNPYNQSEGMETAGGFISRFTANSSIYLSKYFPILTGFKPAMSLSKHPILTILLYAWFIIGMVRFYKRNQYLFFTGIYLAFMLGATFFALQTLWDQVRLIIPFFPLMLIFLIETVVSYASKSRYAWKQKVPVALVALSILLISAQTIRQTDFSAIFKNISGDRYYGYTPDWQNYLKMVEHTATELPEGSLVACRKPNMARLSANGKKYHGIYRYNTENADSLLILLYERDVTHIIAASLRKNPRMNTGQFINTIHRYMTLISKEYPQAFILQKKIGEDEPAWLFKINYEAWMHSDSIKGLPKNKKEK